MDPATKTGIDATKLHLKELLKKQQKQHEI